MDEKPKRRWLRFSIRTLLVAVAVISACAAYLRSEYLLVEQRRAYWDETLNNHRSPVRVIGVHGDARSPIPWVRWLLNDPWCPAIVYFRTEADDAARIRRAKEVFPEARFYAIPDTPGFRSLEGKGWMI